MWVIGLIAAYGADPEAERLAEALFLAAREGEWRAVERRYEKLVLRHPAGLEGSIHVLASQASRSRGELLLTAQRLQRVREAEAGYERAQGSLDVLKDTTGLVMIGVEPGDLVPEQMPFIPDLKRAIENASGSLREDGVFVGLLPVGRYRIGERDFEVQKGFTWTVVASKGE